MCGSGGVLTFSFWMKQSALIAAEKLLSPSLTASPWDWNYDVQKQSSEQRKLLWYWALLSLVQGCCCYSSAGANWATLGRTHPVPKAYRSKGPHDSKSGIFSLHQGGARVLPPQVLVWGLNTVVPGAFLNALGGECSTHSQCWDNLGQLLRKIPPPCLWWYIVFNQRQTVWLYLVPLTRVHTSLSLKELQQHLLAQCCLHYGLLAAYENRETWKSFIRLSFEHPFGTAISCFSLPCADAAPILTAFLPNEDK